MNNIRNKNHFDRTVTKEMFNKRISMWIGFKGDGLDLYSDDEIESFINKQEIDVLEKNNVINGCTYKTYNAETKKIPCFSASCDSRNGAVRMVLWELSRG